MGTHMKVLSESFPMNTNMTGFRCFPKNLSVFLFWMKVASSLEGLRLSSKRRYKRVQLKAMNEDLGRGEYRQLHEWATGAMSWTEFLNPAAKSEWEPWMLEHAFKPANGQDTAYSNTKCGKANPCRKFKSHFSGRKAAVLSILLSY